MPTFKYSAVGTDGRTVKGNIEASSQGELVEELRRRSLTPLRVEEKSGGARAPKPARATPAPSASGVPPAKKGLSMDIHIGAMKPGVRKKDEIVIFTRQLATMVGAGIPLLECLEILREQAASRQFNMLLGEVVASVRGGEDLSTSINRYPKVFTDVYVSMIKAGEASGQLDDILLRLAEYLESTQRLKRNIKSAMTYPVVSLVLIFGITFFLMIFIIPKFKEIFVGLGVELPGLTKITLGASAWCENNYPLIFVGMIGAFILLKIYKGTKNGRTQWDWLMLHLPVFGNLFQKVGLARFSKTFATMLRSGVPILGALEIVADTSGNVIIADAVLNARENVRKGEPLAEPLAASPVFPPMVTRMIGIGEKTGSLEQLLDKIAEFYEEQVNATVKQLTSLIEPIMIAIMGLLVGTICLSVFLPIFELQKQLAAR
ncbi:MAG: type II secretion system F family protein [Planctomycetota bacterium]